MKSSLTILFLCASLIVFSQKRNVLFIGDSYTSYNNLPLTVADLAAANGDTMTYNSSTPGGYTLEMQWGYAPTLNLIRQGGWDYVVIQAQSEEPAFPPGQVDTATFPYATKLDSLIHSVDSCTEVVFYLTWGHQNGDPLNCPYVPQICTYTGMQDRLTQSYLQMGQMNHASVAPVGEAWRTIFDEPHPYDLYIADSIHPSIFGTYLAASVIYGVLFQKSVLNDTFVTAGIPDSDAVVIRQVAYSTLYDSLPKWLGYGHIPFASFSDSVAGAQVNFSSTGLNGTNFTWHYGDGQTGAGINTSHTYTASGRYQVSLTVYDQCKIASYSDSISVTVPSGLAMERIKFADIYPDPASSSIHIVPGSMETSGYTVTMTDRLGQVCRRQFSESNQSTIDVSALADGIYIIHIASGTADYHYPVSVVH